MCIRDRLHIQQDEMPKFMDATDALGAAYCHFLQMNRPETDAKHYSCLLYTSRCV